MKVTIEPGVLNGHVVAPPSKSMTQRVLAGALLHKGHTVVQGAGNSDDELAALRVIQQLGAEILVQAAGLLHISSQGVAPVTDIIDCGESGLAARMFVPLAALSDRRLRVTGTGTLLNRPMHVFATVLPQLQAAVTMTHDRLPLEVQGPLVPADLEIDGSESSQFLSGLLFALSCVTQDRVITITARDLKSRPYISMSLWVLRQFGYRIEQDDFRIFRLYGHDQHAAGQPVQIRIDGDWSSAAFMLVAGALAGSVTVQGLQDNNLQADSAVAGLLREVGADVRWQDGSLTVKKSHLHAFEFDATDCPDLFPVLAVLAACCRGESYIRGVHRLFHKESNRAESIGDMLDNFNVPYSIEEDALCITGMRMLQGTVIDSHHDHRIAMAAAVGALRANGPVDILHAEAVSKSYPAYFEELIMCGVTCTFDSDK